MRMTQLSSENKIPNHKLPKTTDEQLQNELHYHLAEKMLMKLHENKLISQEELIQINELNRQIFKPLLGPLMCDKP